MGISKPTIVFVFAFAWAFAGCNSFLDSGTLQTAKSYSQSQVGGTPAVPQPIFIPPPSIQSPTPVPTLPVAGPTVSVTSPASGAFVGKSITLSSVVTASGGSASVQYQVDGSNMGAPVSVAPYLFTLNTTALSNAVHTIRAVVKDALGNSATSTTVSVTVDNIAPSAASGLSGAGISSSQIKLTWNASTDNNAVTSYQVMRNGSIAGSVSSGLSFTDVGLSAATPYSYQIVAFDAAQNASAGSAVVSVNTLANAPQGAAHPHEPAGYTRVAETTFGQVPAAISTVYCAGQLAGVLEGCIEYYTSSPIGQKYQLLNSQTFPSGATTALRIILPKGLSVGSGGSVLDFRNGSKTSTTPEYREWYETAWFRIPTADFENNGVATKILGYWDVGDNSGNSVYSYAGNNVSVGNVALQSSFPFSMIQQGTVSRRMDQNRGNYRPVVAGRWNRYEIQMILNSGCNVGDGTLRFWLDNGDGNGLVLTHEYTNVAFQSTVGGHTDGCLRKFYNRHWAPIWGGGSPVGAVKQRSDSIDVDDLYISGVP